MGDEQISGNYVSGSVLTFEEVAPEIEVRSESKREVAVRIMKWDTVGETAIGKEKFRAGAFDGVRPEKVILRMEHEGPPAGRAIALERQEDGQIAVFKVASTSRGDELLTLARDGYYTGASPSFMPLEGGSVIEGRGSDRVTVRTKVDLREVSLTWRPTYSGTGVLYARTQEGKTEMAEANAEAPKYDPSALVPLQDRLSSLEQREMAYKETEATVKRLNERIEKLQERSNGEPTNVEVPKPIAENPYVGDWFQAAATLMDGGQLTTLQERALTDLLTTANVGVVPPAYTTELIGIINKARPFMETTRRMDMPANGMQIIFPRIGTRPTVAEQTTQKTEVSSGAVTTDTVTANVRTFAGAGDISLQLLRRSDPSFLNLYLELLAERYARAVDAAAVAALIAGTPAQGGTFTVGTAAFPLGTAFTNSVTAIMAPPDTMWVGTAVLAAMINARTTTNQPLYEGISTFPTANAASLEFGRFMGLRVVWDLALDTLTYDADVTAGVQNTRVIVGPSSGFAWAEEGTFTLTADNAGRLGRDVALAGFVAFLPLYPAAFTAYAIA